MSEASRKTSGGGAVPRRNINIETPIGLRRLTERTGDGLFRICPRENKSEKNFGIGEGTEIYERINCRGMGETGFTTK